MLYAIKLIVSKVIWLVSWTFVQFIIWSCISDISWSEVSTEIIIYKSSQYLGLIVYLFLNTVFCMFRIIFPFLWNTVYIICNFLHGITNPLLLWWPLTSLIQSTYYVFNTTVTPLLGRAQPASLCTWQYCHALKGGEEDNKKHQWQTELIFM